MDRRHFTRLGGLTLAGAWLPGPTPQSLQVDPARLGERMRRLATFGANASGGIDRVAFSDANIEALDWVAELLVEVGFETEIDLAGNLIARKDGSATGLRPIMFGSHIDSVPNGGNFDGQVGSMGAVEVAVSPPRAMH